MDISNRDPHLSTGVRFTWQFDGDRKWRQENEHPFAGSVAGTWTNARSVGCLLTGRKTNAGGGGWWRW